MTENNITKKMQMIIIEPIKAAIQGPRANIKNKASPLTAGGYSNLSCPK